MNVVLFTDTYLPEINGVATSLFNLRKTLVEHGTNVLVVSSGGPDVEKMEYKDGIIRIAGFEAMKGYDYHIATFYNQKAFEIVRDFKPDLIHSNHDGPIGQFGFICAQRLNLPIVYTYHTMYEDYTHYVTKGHFDIFAKKIVRGYINLKSVQADEFIAPSEKIKNYFRSIGVDKYINVVPTGIDFQKFMQPSMSEKEKAELRESLGISPNDYVLLFLGRIAKEKSIDVLIRGYADYLKGGEETPTKFLIVGGGPLLDELKGLAEDLGIADHVIFAGPVLPDLTQRYYQISHLFLSASVSETQGLTYMEAMASSLLVLARYDDNLAGTIQEGKTGFFFYDEEDFKEHLSSIIRLPESGKKAIIANAMKALEPYSLDAFYRNINEVYLRAIKKNW